MIKKSGRYNASLQTRSLTESQCRVAEGKYLGLLEKAFGSASKVRGAYCEYVAVKSLGAENPWDEPTADELEVIVQWEKAAKEASLSVFEDMKINDRDAFFELQVWNSRSS